MNLNFKGVWYTLVVTFSFLPFTLLSQVVVKDSPETDFYNNRLYFQIREGLIIDQLKIDMDYGSSVQVKPLFPSHPDNKLKRIYSAVAVDAGTAKKIYNALQLSGKVDGKCSKHFLFQHQDIFMTLQFLIWGKAI